MPVERSYEKQGRYDFSAIEARWQRYWEERETFRAHNPGEAGAQADQPKYYILDMFPYPSGAGLHVGHPLGYCATDIVARYKRMCGFNVLHPMGFDAFGLPAEQYAIEHNVHPAQTTNQNIEMYRRQLKMFGFSYDWSREIITCDPNYYRFTQWIFLRLYGSWYDEQMRWTAPDGGEILGRARPIHELVAELESGRWGVNGSSDIERTAGTPGRREWATLSEPDRRIALDRRRLAYLDEVPVNWCPALGTVLSNEEVDSEGRSERGDHPVFRRPLRQWMLRITQFADRLISDLDAVDWPEPIKIMQRNWIGRSTGAEVLFPLARAWRIDNGRWKRTEGGDPAETAPNGNGFPDAIRVYTTRPDTLFGATYMVLAPEHELVQQITTPQRQDEVTAYVAVARNRSELDRTADTREKTGVFTGGYAINPANGEPIPVWVADYVLMGYGTGAIMAVPGGDTRDFEFACKFDLEIVAVVKPPAEWIMERVEAMVGGIEKTADAGFDRINQEFPELAERVARHRAQSAGLGASTLDVLNKNVGVDRLIEHYTRHPRSWGAAFAGEGSAVNSPPSGNSVNVPGGVCSLDGLATSQAKDKIIAWLEANGVGRGAVHYKMRDWVFSRQKYWGEPFPILHGSQGETIALDDAELPVELPPMENFKPVISADDADAVPDPPLGRARDWLRVDRNGSSYRRDLNTMPQWAGSCWYYLRFITPKNPNHFCDSDAERYWMPVDLYVGGAEHAVLHLLYARFWHKVLFDLGHVSTREPFRKLFNQGMIQGFAYRDSRGRLVPADQIEEREPEKFFLKGSGEPVARVVAKMSKSLKNVVSPDDVIARYGADTFRLYEMYMGPLDASKPWNTRDVPGLFKLCQRIWRLFVDEDTGRLSGALTDAAPDEAALRIFHKTVQRVTSDIEQLKFNTAIAALFDFVNFMTPKTTRPRAVMEPFVLLASPFVPHLGEELWRRLGHDATLAYEPWPEYDEHLARDEQVEIAVQIGGKIKARIMVPADADRTTLEAAALNHERVKDLTASKTIRKVIVVPGRLVNIIVG